MSIANNVKLVIVGDGTVGKTSLCNVFVKKDFTKSYEATVFENYSEELFICGHVSYLYILSYIREKS